MARIHIPVFTDPACIHSTDGTPFHMPADGSVYMIWVNVPHQVSNNSNIDRYHIIMDAYDTQGITEEFKYPGNIRDLEIKAEFYRNMINNTELTADDIKYFTQLKKQFIK
jgi:3,4-dihydroxy-2-butanone 4-phosphate synthase